MKNPKKPTGKDLLTSLSSEELSKITPPTKEEIKNALKKGYDDMKKCEKAMFAKKGRFY